MATKPKRRSSRSPQSAYFGIEQRDRRDGSGANDPANQSRSPRDQRSLHRDDATDRDIGLQLLADVDEWDKFTLRDPKGREVMMQARTEGRPPGWGLTELSGRRPSPSSPRCRRASSRSRSRRAITFKGRTVDGRKIVGSDRLTT